MGRKKITDVVTASGIMTSKSFLDHITKIATTGDRVDYLDDVIDFCERNSIEMETAAAVIKNNPKFKALLYQQAETLNLVPKIER